MPQFDPWTNVRFGFPRKDAPAFQREWMPLSSSGVQITTINTDLQTVVKAPSSVGVSGTIFVWGISFCTSSSNPQALEIRDDNSKVILSMVSTQDGPFFLQLSTPIRIAANSGLSSVRVVEGGATPGTWCTIYYTSTHLKYE